ncbi:glycosyltransferase [Vibrio kanaloae]|uniref:glycosyltransferase n=1 Tax=Vibrio kanaloae TaxID=170673 RepID=UPI00124521F7|nr:glycosyltransferase [Vibrio kanaloae]KAB0460950.1 glycosyltransferase [Vibrio kanaloae]
MNKYMVNYDLRQGGAERVFHSLSCYEGSTFNYILLKENRNFSYQDEQESSNLNILSNSECKFFPYIKLIIFFLRNPGCYVSFKYNISFILLVVNFFVPKKRKVYTRVISSISREQSEVGFFKKFYIKFALKKSDGIILQSKGMIGDAVSAGVSDYKVINNPLGSLKTIDITEASPRFVLFVGRINLVKQIEHIVEAYSKSNFPKDGVFLYIVGEGCMSVKSSVSELARKLGVSEMLVFLGSVNDVHNYYAKAEVLMLTSKYEGFPNVLSEAISYNCPVISYDCISGPSDIIIDGVNGFLIPQDDIDSLTTKLNNISELSGSDIRHTVERFNVMEVNYDYEEYVR